MPVYFEDVTVGESQSFGSYDVTEADVLAFAEAYDPQWFHTDPERAREESLFGSLAASGWHTASMTMRLLVDNHFADTASYGAVGVDALRWPNPTFPGETLSVTVEVLEKTPSESKPDRGTVRTRVTTENEAGEPKLTMEPIVLYARHTPGEAT
ncbi:MaoC family dehydratase [Halobacterium salinarum]|uniref:MaoC family dehydratase n=1 Tax=Halobacterium TaxID=2239 RepID=UPI00196269A8|nr:MULTISPECIES: MaoC family dehydratase [Halobacterium]MCF2165190.1 MaoC family dehydratase [Halobacterium salinarum]MCF2168001.1 MaoC family dehydratase [Halobacterium salinarum]MCF2238677.1 MaoC family dehydratase [Halobacterium salinarum]MDL0124846.1 MaoC family dehydratase [Halobacterium salinarum]MDL0126854.1 MaoC family dehydratase [Halobacterium salinarum]